MVEVYLAKRYGTTSFPAHSEAPSAAASRDTAATEPARKVQPQLVSVGMLVSKSTNTEANDYVVPKYPKWVSGGRDLGAIWELAGGCKVGMGL